MVPTQRRAEKAKKRLYLCLRSTYGENNSTDSQKICSSFFWWTNYGPSGGGGSVVTPVGTGWAVDLRQHRRLALALHLLSDDFCNVGERTKRKFWPSGALWKGSFCHINHIHRSHFRTCLLNCHKSYNFPPAGGVGVFYFALSDSAWVIPSYMKRSLTGRMAVPCM